MGYTRQQFEEAVERFGEVFVVLDSDREYQVHGTESYEFHDLGDGNTIVRVEGVRGDEYLIVEFPLDAIEHHYTHKEV